jgi:hypothetical protein
VAGVAVVIAGSDDRFKGGVSGAAGVDDNGGVVCGTGDDGDVDSVMLAEGDGDGGVAGRATCACGSVGLAVGSAGSVRVGGSSGFCGLCS